MHYIYTAHNRQTTQRYESNPPCGCERRWTTRKSRKRENTNESRNWCLRVRPSLKRRAHFAWFAAECFSPLIARHRHALDFLSPCFGGSFSIRWEHVCVYDTQCTGVELDGERESSRGGELSRHTLVSVCEWPRNVSSRFRIFVRPNALITYLVVGMPGPSTQLTKQTDLQINRFFRRKKRQYIACTYTYKYMFFFSHSRAFLHAVNFLAALS